MALGEIEQAQKLARAALALQPDLGTKYVREQEWYRDRDLLEKLMRRLIEAGVPERCGKYKKHAPNAQRATSNLVITRYSPT